MLVIGILAVFTYAKFVQIPYVGFEFAQGKVSLIFVPTPKNALQVGDQLIIVGQVEISEFLKDLHKTIFDDIRIGKSIPLVVERNGQTLTIDWIIPGPDRVQLLQRFNSLWWLPYVFWMAGTATLLFIRPKDTRWKLLIAFNYLTAIWLAAGGGPSHWHTWHSAIIMRSAVWLCLPVYLHFHWVFPRPLKRLPTFVWVTLYLLGVALAISEWFQIPPASAYYGGFLLAVVGSIILLVVRSIFQKEYRRDTGFLGLALMLMMLPPLGVSLTFLLNASPPGFVQGGSFLGLPALPGAYFFVAYRHQFRELAQRMKRLTRLYIIIVLVGTVIVMVLSIADIWGNLAESTFATGLIVIIFATLGAMTGFSPFLVLPALAGSTYQMGRQVGEMEIRANRLLSLYLFTVLVGSILTAGIILSNFLINIPGETTIIGVGAALFAGMITAIGFAPFQRFVDRYVLGIQLPPDEILKSYSDRIITSLDHQSLIRFLKGELLPSLFIRQSILLRIDNTGVMQFLSIGIDASQIPDVLDIPLFQAQAGKILAASGEALESYPWIRLVLLLQVNGETIGLWLFGRRDPDDFYAQTEVDLLQTLANQTAIALVNIEQAERLHALYQANIDWHEEERTALARNLHDDVLGQLALLSIQTTSTDSPEFQERYRLVASRLRQMVTNLRPAMLSYGLWAALEECVDELSERIENQTSITLEIPSSESRYDPKIEEHLYRIMQQACENALRHAQAKAIQVRGNLEPDKINLVVEDDGVGFADLEHLDFNTLLANKHFGLAGMFERADLIGAELKVDSIPGGGTRVSVSWYDNSPGE